MQNHNLYTILKNLIGNERIIKARGVGAIVLATYARYRAPKIDSTVLTYYTCYMLSQI